MSMVEQMLFFIQANRNHDGFEFKLCAKEWLMFQEARNEFGIGVVKVLGSSIITYMDDESTGKKIVKVEKIKGL